MSSSSHREKAAELVKELSSIVKKMSAQLEEKEKLAETAQSRIEELVADIQLKTSKIDRLNRTIKEMREKAETATELMVKNKALQDEVDGIRNQLEKMSETYRELAKEQEASIPVQELLALYIALLEDVFSGQPHAKALFILHGAKKEMAREAITKTAGHEATAIRKALGDLDRAGLIEYDVETGIARLKKRLYSS
jgi:DNA repair exonuclease SbcCD ATPase subunit